MDRRYLFVPFEERENARQRGALWDAESKLWYIDSSTDVTPFRVWLGAGTDVDFAIVTEEAYVVAASARCWKCRAEIEVICLYCKHGLVGTETYSEFSVSSISAVDAALEEQLKGWPAFRWRFDRSLGRRVLTNVCTHCGASQADYYLHCEPGGPFFTLDRAAPGGARFTPLAGRVQLDGDEGFAP
jgi:hypothetical protein